MCRNRARRPVERVRERMPKGPKVTPPRNRPTTRADRAKAALRSIDLGKSRSLAKQSTHIPFDEARFNQTAERLQLDHRQRAHFADRTCACLFVLEELAESVLKTVHTKGPEAKRGTRDLTGQNAKLLRLFDPKGNALYERRCVSVLFGLSNNRYARLHQLAQVENKVKLVHKRDVTTADVELGRVVLPDDVLLPPGPLSWFSKLNPNDTVELRLRRGHGLEGKASNNALERILGGFLPQKWTTHWA